MAVTLLRYALPVFVPVALAAITPDFCAQGLTQHQRCSLLVGQYANALPQPWWVLSAGRLLLLGGVSLGVGHMRLRQDRLVERLRHDSERFLRIAEHASEVVVWVEEGRVAWVSNSIEELCGRPASACIGLPVLPLVHHSQRRSLWAQVRRLSDQDRLLVRVRVALAPPRSWRWIELQIKKLPITSGGDGLILAFRCVDREVAAEAQLRRAATHDPLTGLLNRQSLFDRLTPLLSGAERRSQSLALLFIDVDGFKAINDADGHAAGDTALRVLAERLRQQIRQQDLAARIGGDEILVCLRGVDSLDQALRVCEKIRAAALEPIPWHSGGLRCSLSIGIALARPGDTVDSLIDRADQAMYQAKREGRDRVISV